MAAPLPWENGACVQPFLSPKDLAKAVGVSESSVKRWVDQGRIQAHRTVGGHRRIATDEAVQFVREARMPLVRPELLGLGGLASKAEDPGSALLLKLLSEGASVEARGLLIGWYLEGVSIAALADGPLHSSLEALGELWRCEGEEGQQGIAIEHRATDICLQAVNHLRLLLPSQGEEAPLAVGGSPDVYLLGTQLASAVMAEAGWRSVNLGAQTPLDVLALSVDSLRPRLVWLSLSDEAVTHGLGNGVQRLLESVERAGGMLMVGGRCHREANLPSHPRLREGESMSDLASFARGLLRPGVCEV